MKSKLKQFGNWILPLAIPGLITCAVVVFTLICKGIWPFGSNRIDYFDNMQQVAPLYTHLWDWMHGKASLWFDWYTGLGTNVSMSISAFSMLSPFNLLLFFVPRNLILESISLLTVIKMVCMSVTMYIYLNYRYKKLQYHFKALFAVMFSMCGYVILYASAFTPWMDIVALFPLFMLSFYRMMQTGKKLFYIGILGLMFIINYYLSAMSLVYVFFISAIVLYLEEDRKQWKTQVWNLGVSTVAGIGVSAFVLMPVMTQLSKSQRGSGGGNMISQYKGWVTSAIISDGFMAAFQRWMMLYGMSIAIAIIIVGLKRFWAQEKKQSIAHTCMLGMMAVLMVVQGVNLMWHFGSYNGYSLRNGYLIAFTILSIAAYYAEKLYVTERSVDKVQLKKQAIIAAVICVVFAIGYNLIPQHHEIFAIVFFFAILIIMTIYYTKRLTREAEQFNIKSVILVVLTELFVATYALTGLPKFYTYEDYQVGDYVQAANDVYEDEALGIEASVTNRIINPDISLNANYPLILRRGALSSFTAALQTNTQPFAKRWGYSKYFLWLLDSGGTVFTNALIHVTEAVNQAPLDASMYTLKQTSGDYSLYEAKYQLPFALAVDDEIVAENMAADWVTMHNKMYTAITKDKEELVSGISYALSRTDNSMTYDLSVGHNKAVYMSIADTSNRDGDANASKLESSMHIYVNGEAITVPTLGNVENTAYFTDYNNNLLYLGTFDNENVTVHITFDKPKYMKRAEVMMGQLDMDKMQAMCAQHANDQTEVSYTNNTLTVKMTGTASQNLALIPVVYSKNWKVTVNGKPAKFREIAGLFTGVSIYAGDNTIEFTFVPKGLKEGCAATAAVLLIIVLCCIVNAFKAIRIPNWLEYCGLFVYAQILNAALVLMFLIPILLAVPACVYQIAIRVMHLFAK